MNHQERLAKLISSLDREVGLAQAGSSQGQFPILDLLGNLRDEFAGQPETGERHAMCAAAWERVVKIVESGNPFGLEDMVWLNDFLTQLRTPAAVPAPAPTPPTADPVTPPTALEPVVVAAPVVAVVEETLNLDIAGDGDLLREFITESREHLDNIEQGVLVLENQPADAETLNTIFRAFHTFKGGAGFLNLIPINRLAHVLESLLDLARQSSTERRTLEVTFD